MHTTIAIRRTLLPVLVTTGGGQRTVCRRPTTQKRIEISTSHVIITGGGGVQYTTDRANTPNRQALEIAIPSLQRHFATHNGTG